MSKGQRHNSVFRETPGADRSIPAVAPTKDWIFRSSVVIVFGGAIALRLWAINFGLPNLYHPDEWRIVARALSFGTGNFHPGSFELGTLGMYVCFLLFAAYAVIGLAFGQFSSIHDFAVSYFIDRTPFHLIARGLFFICGLVSIYLVFLIGRRLAGRWAGLSAAALMGVFPVHVFRSHLAFPDTMMLCFMAGALYVMIRDREPTWSYKKDALVGLLIGLGVATKYVAVFMVVGYIVWRIGRAWVQHVTCLGVIKRLAVGATACVAGFFVGMPYFFLDFQHAFSTITGIEGSAQVVGLGAGSGFREVTETLLSPGNIGIVALVCGALGLMVALRRWPAYAAGLISIGALNAVWALRRERLMVRWLFAAELVLCIGTAYLIGWLYSRLRASTSAKVANTCATVMVIGILWTPLLQTIRQNYDLTSPDTRTGAKQWIETNLPSGTKILIVGTRAYNPQPRGDQQTLSRWIYSAEVSGTKQYGAMVEYYRYQLAALSRVSGPKYRIWKLKHYSPSAPEYEYQVPLATFLQDDIEYVVTNDWDHNEYRFDTTPAAQEFYRALRNSCAKVAVFGPNHVNHGPRITIWRTPVGVQTEVGKQHRGRLTPVRSGPEEADRT